MFMKKGYTLMCSLYISFIQMPGQECGI